MISLGKVVLALACNSVMAIQRDNLQTSMELVARNYSADLKNLILLVQFCFRNKNYCMGLLSMRSTGTVDSKELKIHKLI